MPPDFSHPTVFRYAREGSLEFSTSTAYHNMVQNRAEINQTAMNTANTSEQRVTSLWKRATHRMFKSIAVSSAKR
jgi:replicative DNA helicase